MARNVWLIRHAKQIMDPKGGAWQSEAELAPDADERIEAAVRFFRHHGVCFSFVGYSHLVRARQTAERLGTRLKNYPLFLLKGRLGPGEIDEWQTRWDAWKQAQPDPDNPRILGATELAELWPDLCEREGKRVLDGVREIAHILKDGENGAAISHNPLLRLAEAQATGNPVASPDPTYCQTIQFTFEDDHLTSCYAHVNY